MVHLINEIPIICTHDDLYGPPSRTDLAGFHFMGTAPLFMTLFGIRCFTCSAKTEKITHPTASIPSIRSGVASITNTWSISTEAYAITGPTLNAKLQNHLQDTSSAVNAHRKVCV